MDLEENKKLKGIDSILLINLAHRGDRLELFEQNHPYLKGLYTRFDAIYGKNISLTPEIQYLFRNNIFGWKKNIMGCALSHYRLWQKIANGDFGERVLILEDDVLLQKNFVENWDKMVDNIPLDKDLIFLGGVLPVNMWVLPKITEPVNDCLARIAKNTYFGGSSKRYMHFCTYSYLMTKKGAGKICNKILISGINMPIDNYMLNYDENTFTVCFTTPLLSNCTQFIDKQYHEADFDTSDIVNYDSDIMNNNERFNNDEIEFAKNQKLPFIDSICVINLKERKDKFDLFVKNHPFLEGKYERFDAINGQTLEITKEIMTLFRNNHHYWVKSAIGHTLSHYRIWKKLLNGELGENVLILEDDAVLDPNFLALWSKLVEQSLPNDYTIISLGDNGRHLTNSNGSSFIHIPKNELYGTFSTNSYVLSRKNAIEMCNMIDHIGFAFPIRNYIYYFTDLIVKIYTTSPILSKSIRNGNDEIFNTTIFDSQILSDYMPIISFNDSMLNISNKMWFEEIFGKKFIMYKSSEPINLTGFSNIILLYNSNVNSDTIEKWISKYKGFNYFLLHLNDESCTSKVDIYNNPHIKKVFRNYWRPDVVGPKVIHLPVGYNDYTKINVPPLSERKYVWAFLGNVSKPHRKRLILQLVNINLKYALQYYTDGGEILPMEHYMGILSYTKIIPCLPCLYNPECSRFYEALEMGAVPIVHFDSKNSYANVLNGIGTPPLIGCDESDWSNVEILGKQSDFTEILCEDMQNWWSDYKTYLKNLISKNMQ